MARSMAGEHALGKHKKLPRQSCPVCKAERFADAATADALARVNSRVQHAVAEWEPNANTEIMVRVSDLQLILARVRV